ncbi:MAG: hypothetical protein ACRCX2_01410 [Paraclostridium sp.]
MNGKKERFYVITEDEFDYYGFTKEQKDLITEDCNRVVDYVTLEELYGGMFKAFGFKNVTNEEIADFLENTNSFPQFLSVLPNAYSEELKRYLNRKNVSTVEFQTGLKAMVEYDKKISEIKGDE